MANSGKTEFIALTAFVGAAFGGVGFLASLFSGDAFFGLLAITGSASCTALWRHYLRT